MNKEHLEDFIYLAEDLEVKVGDLVSFYTYKAIELSNDGFNPSVNNYYKAYLLTMKKYLIDKDYKK